MSGGGGGLEEERQREMEEEAEEKDLYSGAQTRPDQARLVWLLGNRHGA